MLSVIAILTVGLLLIAACAWLWISTFDSATIGLTEEFLRRGLGCILLLIGLFLLALGGLGLLTELGGGA